MVHWHVLRLWQGRRIALKCWKAKFAPNVSSSVLQFSRAPNVNEEIKLRNGMEMKKRTKAKSNWCPDHSWRIANEIYDLMIPEDGARALVRAFASQYRNDTVRTTFSRSDKFIWIIAAENKWLCCRLIPPSLPSLPLPVACRLTWVMFRKLSDA